MLLLPHRKPSLLLLYVLSLACRSQGQLIGTGGKMGNVLPPREWPASSMTCVFNGCFLMNIKDALSSSLVSAFSKPCQSQLPHVSATAWLPKMKGICLVYACMPCAASCVTKGQTLRNGACAQFVSYFVGNSQCSSSGQAFSDAVKSAPQPSST